MQPNIVQKRCYYRQQDTDDVDIEVEQVEELGIQVVKSCLEIFIVHNLKFVAGKLTQM